MIVVIADDISGAAELAGVAFERGLSSEVQTRFDPESMAAVVALDTDSRSLKPEQAARRVGGIAREVAAARPALIYKKTDSVLRGGIVAEIDGILGALDWGQALLIPANPSRGRVIRSGEYFVDETPLAETEFASDPTHPTCTSSVLELLGPSNCGGTSSVRCGDPIFDRGITVPDVSSADNLRARAGELENGILPAGGAEFFGAILDSLESSASHSARTRPNQMTGEQPGVIDEGFGASLMVCGSRAAWVNGRRAQAKERGVGVLELPDEFVIPIDGDSAETDWDDWLSQVRCSLREAGAAMIAIGVEEPKGEGMAKRMLDRLCLGAASILGNEESGRLYLEGGATARALVEEMGWTRFEAIGAVDGLSWMRPAGAGTPTILIKPGSYDWPEAVWNEISGI